MISPAFSLVLALAFLPSLLIEQASAAITFASPPIVSSVTRPSTSDPGSAPTTLYTTFLTSTTDVVEIDTVTETTTETATSVSTSVTSSPKSFYKTLPVLSTTTIYTCTATVNTTSTTTITPPPATNIRRAATAPFPTTSIITTTTATSTSDVTSTATSMLTERTTTTWQVISATEFISYSTQWRTKIRPKVCTSTLVATATACATGNLIQNPGFENGKLDGWVIPMFPSIGIDNAVIPDPYLIGYAYRQLFGPTIPSKLNGPDFLNQINIPVSPRNSYTFSGRVTAGVSGGQEIAQCTVSLTAEASGSTLLNSTVFDYDYYGLENRPPGVKSFELNFDAGATATSVTVGFAASCTLSTDVQVSFIYDEISLTCTSS